MIDHLAPARRSMRVAVVTETYPPEVNGVASTLARVVDGLHRHDHDLQLIRPRQGGESYGGEVERLRETLTRGLPIPRYPNLRMGVPAKRALVRCWSLNRPDIVHIATEGPLGWSALNAALALKLPVSSDFRTNFHAYSQHYGIGWLNRPIVAYLRGFHNRTGCTMVPTERLRASLAGAGFKRLAVVSRGVDIRLFDPARRDASLRAQWGVDDRAPVIAYVGRLAAEKNLDTLILAYEAIRRAVPQARLLLVGSGPMRDALQARCPGAIFAGQRLDTDLAAHYACADLFLFPSLTETFGNVTTEAMASGLPVLAFDEAAAAQLIESGRNGQLIASGDADAFIRAAVELARDPERRLRFGAGARQTALTLDWDLVVQRFEGVLRSVIETHAQGAREPTSLAEASAA